MVTQNHTFGYFAMSPLTLNAESDSNYCAFHQSPRCHMVVGLKTCNINCKGRAGLTLVSWCFQVLAVPSRAVKTLTHCPTRGHQTREAQALVPQQQAPLPPPPPLPALPLVSWGHKVFNFFFLNHKKTSFLCVRMWIFSFCGCLNRIFECI